MTRIQKRFGLSTILILAQVSCGGSPDNSKQSTSTQGGAGANTGGSAAAGGHSNNSGGRASQGGTSAGGATGSISGGTDSTGGSSVVATGGTAVGGTTNNPNVGGTKAQGGSSSSSVGGGIATGGKSSKTSTGGANTQGGSSTVITGGTSGTGGTSASAGGLLGSDIIPPDRRIAWNPGIVGGIPSVTTECSTTACTALKTGNFGSGSKDATSAIQAAINSCPDGQFVHLPAGSYTTSGTIQIVRSNVVLRGDGADTTKIVPNNVGGIAIGDNAASSTTGVNVTGGLNKGSTSLTVASAATFTVGDLITITQVDDGNSLIETGDCTWYKLDDNPNQAGGERSMGQTFEVTSVSGNTLGISSPLYMDFSTTYKPQVVKSATTPAGVFRNVGIENLRISGGNGDHIDMTHASHCWVKNVESDNVNGRHMLIVWSSKCVVRDSYIHDSQDYNSGGSAYGIQLDMYTSDTLVENNIGLHLNFPILFGASGGGNVMAYNYVDETVLGGSDGWLMPGIGSHCSFSHMELIEGNWASQICMDNVHGGTGYITFYRNNSFGQNSTQIKNSSLIALSISAGSYYANALGNVLLESGVSAQYDSCNGGAYLLGGYQNPGDGCSIDALVKKTIFRNGNYDFVTKGIKWDEDDANDSRFASMSHALPDSLYLTGKPAFFGSNAWPWVDSSNGTTKTLPAKARFDSGSPNVVP